MPPSPIPPLPFDVPDLRADLFALIRQIPSGAVTSFGHLATALGDGRQARWIPYEFGVAPDDVPLHRVVPRTGEVLESFREPLIAEGVRLEDGRLPSGVSMFDRFETTFPLVELRELQEELRKTLTLDPLPELPDVVGGVDVAYPNDGDARGAYVEVDVATGLEVFSTTIDVPARFPYVSGYLSFRELPVLWELLRKVTTARPLPPVLFVDGSGIVHPRGAGLAAHLGGLLDHPTLGVAKKLLFGSVDLEEMSLLEPRPIRSGDAIIGTAVVGRKRSRPVFLSPGHRMSVTDVTTLSMRLFRGHRLPEPTYQADRLSKRKDL